MTAWPRLVIAGLLIAVTVGLVGVLSLPYTMLSPVWLVDIEHEQTWDVMLTEQDPIHDIFLFGDLRLSIEYLRTNGSPITIELHSDREGGAIVSIRNVTEINGPPLIFLQSGEPDIIKCSLKRETNDTSVEVRSVVIGQYPSTDIFYSWIHPFSLLGLGLTYFSFRRLSARANFRSRVAIVLFAIIASALMTPMYLYFYNGDYHLITKEVSEDIENLHFELNSTTPEKSLDVPIDIITDSRWLRVEVYTQNASVKSQFVALNGSPVQTLNELAVAAPDYFGLDISETNSAEMTLVLQTLDSEAEIDVTFSAMGEVVEPQVNPDWPSTLSLLGGGVLTIGIVYVLVPAEVLTRKITCMLQKQSC
ncbi:MAG: hypothetical protein ACFFER_01710 [Candidatus Thorarchaeota archaeon]